MRHVLRRWWLNYGCNLWKWLSSGRRGSHTQSARKYIYKTQVFGEDHWPLQHLSQQAPQSACGPVTTHTASDYALELALDATTRSFTSSYSLMYMRLALSLSRTQWAHQACSESSSVGVILSRPTSRQSVGRPAGNTRKSKCTHLVLMSSECETLWKRRVCVCNSHFVRSWILAIYDLMCCVWAVGKISVNLIWAARLFAVWECPFG